MRTRLRRISPWLIIILLSVSLSGSGCKFTITVIDQAGCGGTVTPTSGTVGSCQDFRFTIDPGSCERYSVLVDGDEIPECCPNNRYTGETEWKGTTRVIVVFYDEDSGSGDDLDLGDIELSDDDNPDIIVIIDGGIPTDDIITLTPPPDPPPQTPTAPSCKPNWASCTSHSECCSGNCFNFECFPGL